MRIAIVLTWMMILSYCTSTAQQTYSFPAFDRASLRDVLSYLEVQHDLVFSFRDLSADQCILQLQEGQYSLEDYLNIITSQCSFDYENINEKYILLIPRPFTAENKICGVLLDQEASFPLPYANVMIKGKMKGTSTDENGRFELSEVRIGDTLRISYVGYPTTQIVVNQLPQPDCPNFYLKSAGTDMETVIVTVYLMDGILQGAEGQKIFLNPDKLSVFPGAVEPDIFTAVQMLPGIWSANETASGIYMRGGTPDQNLILYDGIPVYHTGHFFGMISAFNPYNIESVNVYRSGIGSEYGGRVSGVIDIKGKADRPAKVEGDIGFNLTHGHLSTRIPLWKKSSMSLSVRRSFTDFLPTPTFRSFSDKVFQGSKLDDEQTTGFINEPEQTFYFTDFNFKWNGEIGKNKFGMDIFSGQNRLDYLSDLPNFLARGTDVVQLDHTGFGVFWSRDWSKKFSSLVRLTAASFRYRYGFSAAANSNPDEALLETNLINNIADISINWINTWKFKDNHQFRFGVQTTDVQIDFDTNERFLDTSRSENQFFEHRLGTLFAEYHLSLADVMELDMGVRYQYSPVIDNYYFEPRVALTAIVSPQLKLKLSSSKQFQFVSQLVIFDLESIGFANEIWVASDGRIIPVIESNQWAGGIQYTKENWKIDVEGYIKELAGITSLSSSFSLGEQQPFGQGDSRIRGIDVLLQRQITDHYRSWLSYTLAQSIYEFPTFGTSVFPASHDQRHLVQWVHLLNYKPWEFAFGWRYASGLPYSQFIDTEFVNPPNTLQSQPSIVYEGLNNERLIPYHRLDASVMYHFGKKEGLSGHLGLSITNLYNRQNILGRNFVIEDFDRDTDRIDVLTVNRSGLAFTPNLVFRMHW